MTVQKLVDEPRLIIDLAEALRNGMEPQSQFKLPYKITEREQELIEDWHMNYRIDRKRADAKIVTGYYKNESTRQEFPYYLEAVMAPKSDGIRGRSQTCRRNRDFACSRAPHRYSF